MTNHSPIAAAVVSWTCQVLVALILLQTLYFKFTGKPESVHIFATLGVEPWGRYLSGGVELLAAVLLLVPQTPALGAALALGVISGAIVSHLARLGIVVMDDGGLLFGLACAVFVCSVVILVVRRAEIPVLGPRLFVSHAAGGHAPAARPPSGEATR